MTLPHEESHALLQTREFLFDLLNPKENPRVPKAIRLKARALVKHYPYIDRIVRCFTPERWFNER